MALMEPNEQIKQADVSTLAVVKYPDPRLAKVSAPVDEPAAPEVRALVARMAQLMFESRGVGLAAPQVGINVQLFIASPTFQPDDLRVYINPEIVSLAGQQDGEEGCLSFPGIMCKIKRHDVATIRATDLDGQVFEETGEALTARIFQHETDHLNGVRLLDRMGSIAKLTSRRALKELEEQFAATS